jgi:hypothetical protein
MSGGREQEYQVNDLGVGGAVMSTYNKDDAQSRC